MRTLLFLTVTCLTANFLFAQEIDLSNITRKKVAAVRVDKPPKVDADEDALWQNILPATDFIERRPTNGAEAPDSLRTEVRIVYDDYALYFFAKMYDPHPETIPVEITERDDIGNADWFGVFINGFNDNQQSLEFIVSSSGVQFDARLTTTNEDNSYNAVWKSKTKITDYGWAAELEIPYRELRFAEKDIQEWGVNFVREVRRDRINYSWNFIDNTGGSFTLYDGIITGIEDIKPPIRLNLYPFASAYYNVQGSQSETELNGGLDLKYGISDAFTLDLTLIPDFNQAGFDNVVLNLSPFEVQFAEQRPFFLEGTELFERGNLFFSRRIGNSPTGSVDLNENEEVFESPSTVDLINSTKVTGRDKNGWGLGVLNSLTRQTFASIRDTLTGETREQLIEPITNYNVFTIDKRFGDNNSLAIVNTNVLRKGDFRDANATGFYWTLFNKKNTWRFNGNFETSFVFEDSSTKTGTEYFANFSKISGAHRYGIRGFGRSRDYDINDLGFVAGTNFSNYFLDYSYRFLQPKGFLNNLNVNFLYQHRRRQKTDFLVFNLFNVNYSATTKKFFTFGGGFETIPHTYNDIFEPRVEGRHMDIPGYWNVWNWISTDYRKKIALDSGIDHYQYAEAGRYDLSMWFNPRYRVSDKFLLRTQFNFTQNGRQVGWVNSLEDEGGEIIMGRRRRNIFTNEIIGRMAFNENATLELRLRHFVSDATYSDFFDLNQDGTLALNPDYNENHDTTFSSWNLDLRYSWWISPGSQLTVLYRNANTDFREESPNSFTQNFENLFENPLAHSFSVRLVYFLDFNRVGNWFKKRKSIQADNSIGQYHLRKQRRINHQVVSTI